MASWDGRAMDRDVPSAWMFPGHGSRPIGPQIGWAMGRDEPSGCMCPGHGWASVGPQDGWIMGRDGGPQDGCVLARDRPPYHHTEYIRLNSPQIYTTKSHKSLCHHETSFQIYNTTSQVRL